MQNPTTPHLGLPLPSDENSLEEDLPRLIAALLDIDRKFGLLDALLLSDDGTMDELQELVAAIKANAASIGGLMSSKASVALVEALTAVVAANEAEAAATATMNKTEAAPKLVLSFNAGANADAGGRTLPDSSYNVPAPTDGTFLSIIEPMGLYKYVAGPQGEADGELRIKAGTTGLWHLLIGSHELNLAYLMPEIEAATGKAKSATLKFLAAGEVTASDAGSEIACAGGATFAVTLPSAASLPAGGYFFARAAGDGSYSLSAQAGDTFEGSGVGTGRLLGAIMLRSDGVSNWAVTRLSPPGSVEVLTSGATWQHVTLGVSRIRLKQTGAGALTGTYAAAAAGYLEKIIPVSLGTTYSRAVGAVGNPGGATTFTANGVTYTAQGGPTGAGNATAVVGGDGINGDLNIKGGSPVSPTATTNMGGNSPLGFGAATLSGVGNVAATGYGAGPSTTNPGTPGVQIIELLA